MFTKISLATNDNKKTNFLAMRFKERVTNGLCSSSGVGPENNNNYIDQIQPPARSRSSEESSSGKLQFGPVSGGHSMGGGASAKVGLTLVLFS